MHYFFESKERRLIQPQAKQDIWKRLDQSSLKEGLFWSIERYFDFTIQNQN